MRDFCVIGPTTESGKQLCLRMFKTSYAKSGISRKISYHKVTHLLKSQVMYHLETLEVATGTTFKNFQKVYCVEKNRFGIFAF